ncbi:F-box/LRR-repeat protein, partial [Mucuna pruriens]
MSTLNSYYYEKPNYIFRHRENKHVDKKLTQLLKYGLGLSNGNTSCIVFNFYLYLRDVELITVAESKEAVMYHRSPNLKRLVLPATGKLSKVGVEKAMKSWGGLESITFTSLVRDSNIFSTICKYGKNITEMKFNCDFEEHHADAMIEYTRKLKVLSFRSSIVRVKALSRVLSFLEHLEAVNVCHSMILDTTFSKVVLYCMDDLGKHLAPSCLGKLIFCEGGRCLRCKNGRDTTSSRQPYGHLEDIWRQDEITSLAH